MNRIAFIFLFLFSVSLFAEMSPQEMTLGFTPGGDREVLKKGAVILAKELQKKIGIPINVFVPKSYEKMESALQDKRIDFAFLSSLSYVAADEKKLVKVLLKKVWQHPFYYSVLLVKKKSPLKNLDDLKGKVMAFVDQKSTSGYLYPQVMLKRKKWNSGFFREIKFSGSHVQSVAMLEKNEVDVIAVFSDDQLGQKSAWAKYASDKEKNNFRVLWVSEPIPNDPFCVRNDFYEKYPKLTHEMMFALIDVSDQLKSNQSLSDILGANGFVPSTNRHFDPVREMVKALGLAP